MLMCSDYTCSGGYLLHSKSETTMWFEGTCDTEQCCMKWTSPNAKSVFESHTSTTTAIVMCFE